MGFRFDATPNPIAIPSNDELLPNEWTTFLRILLPNFILARLTSSVSIIKVLRQETD